MKISPPHRLLLTIQGGHDSDTLSGQTKPPKQPKRLAPLFGQHLHLLTDTWLHTKTPLNFIYTTTTSKRISALTLRRISKFLCCYQRLCLSVVVVFGVFVLCTWWLKWVLSKSRDAAVSPIPVQAIEPLDSHCRVVPKIRPNASSFPCRRRWRGWQARGDRHQRRRDGVEFLIPESSVLN